MGKLRFIFALWAAKGTKLLMSILRFNGTNYPGQLALKLCPDFLKYIGKPKNIIAVTGTNGKTTCCNLLCSSMEKMGYKVLSNRAGGNIASGLATALIAGSGLTGRTKYENAVLEVDERSALRIFPHIKPQILVITNLTRDSVMRNAHPAYISDILTRGIPKETKLVLNGDDLIAAGTVPENERVYFGIDALPEDTVELKNRIDDLRVCPKCSGTLVYTRRRYHHIGSVHCEKCGYGTPEMKYLAKNVDREAMTAEIGETEIRLVSKSTFNIYNSAAVFAALCEFGIDKKKAAEALGSVELPASRFNEKSGGGVTAVMQMAKDKNAFAISRVFDDVAGKPENKELVLINCCLEDHEHGSENVCWMYDCDFEFLNSDRITRIVCAGPRCRDFYMRLLVAGVPEEKLRKTQKELDAPELLELNEGEKVYILYGTAGIELAEKVQAKVISEAGKRRENR